MPEVGGMLASAMLKMVTHQIGSVISGQLKLLWDFSDDFENLKMTLESMEAVLQDAERRSIQDAAVRLWLKRLTDAMYGISDILEEFETTVKPLGWKFAARMPYLTVRSMVLIANKMKKMKHEVEKIKHQHQQFSFMTDSKSKVQPVPDERETDSYVEDQTLIVGRTEEKRKIIACFSEGMTQDIIILPIYGIGGIGKTTLAKLIFNDAQFKDYSQVWIYVSQMLNLNKVCNSIISQLSKKESNLTERQMIRNHLGQLLTDPNNKKIMIVLDDVWEENDSQLNELKAMLPVIKGGKVVVIVTTRNEHIAMKLCTVKPYKLLPLSDETCWAIIKQKSDFQARDDKEHLEKVGRDIAMKCGGVALAAQALGYMLKPLTFGEWESVRNSDIWNASASQQESFAHHDVLACLLLSYRSMPPALKLCFAYCAFFPKGYKLAKNDLIYQWISHGFIQPSGIFTTIQIGENYAKHLLGMSFLQHSKSYTTVLRHDNVTLFNMHDLVHDLARSIMADGVLETSKMGCSGRKSCRYALLTDPSSPLKLHVSSPAKLRALRYLGYGRIELCGAGFSSAKYLHVLDLSECYIPKLPNCIGDLKHLRYLNARGIQEEEIPACITKLCKLIYLNLGGSLITALPESIGELKCLMHLDLSSCWKIVKLPKSFVDLKELVHLDLQYCRRLGIVPELFMGFKELAYLDLSKCECVRGVVEALGGLTKLQYLDLSGTFMGKKILLSRLQEAMSNLADLRYLGVSSMHSIIRDLSTVEIASFIDFLSSLYNLEHLKLSHNREMVHLPESISRLRKLRTLDLSACKNLVRLPDSIVKMDCLRILMVEGCYNLDMSTLSQSNFGQLSNLVVLSGGISRSHCPDKRLKISGLECIRHEDLAHSIERMRKQRIDELELEWNRNYESTLEDMQELGKLLPPITLKYLELKGYYNSVNFPDWLMSISQYLPNLVEIRMWGLPKCNSLPPFGQLPNLRKLCIWGMDSITEIGEGFYGGVGAFPQLQEFELSSMGSLQEWNTMCSHGEHSVQEVMSGNLNRLTLHDCPKLRLKPCPPNANNWEIENCDNVLALWDEGTQTCASSSTALREVTVKFSNVPMYKWRLLHYLPALHSLRIEKCSDLTCISQEVMRGFSTLESLHLENNDQPELPEWLGEVTTLRELDIRGYPDLQAPPKIMRQLTSLRSLLLFSCQDMISTPEWLGELTSLEELLISDCPELSNLQRSFQYLSSLHSLSFDRCRSIQSLPECFGNLTSLRRVEIIGCRGIKSFPENIRKLPKIEHLSIVPAV